MGNIIYLVVFVGLIFFLFLLEYLFGAKEIIKGSAEHRNVYEHFLQMKRDDKILAYGQYFVVTRSKNNSCDVFLGHVTKDDEGFVVFKINTWMTFVRKMRTPNGSLWLFCLFGAVLVRN